MLNGWHIGTTSESEHLAFLYMHVYTNGAAEGREMRTAPTATNLRYVHAFMARPLNVILVESKSEGKGGVRVRVRVPSFVLSILAPSLVI